MKKVALLLIGLTITNTAQLYSTDYLQSWINYFSAQANNSYSYLQHIDWQKYSQNISTQAKNAYASIPNQQQIARTIQENPEKTATAGFFVIIGGLRVVQSYWNAKKMKAEKNNVISSEKSTDLKDQLKGINKPAQDYKQNKQNQLDQLEKLNNLKNLGRNRTISNFEIDNAKKLEGLRQFMNDAEENETPITYQQIITAPWRYRADKIEDYTSDKFENYKNFIERQKNK